MCLVSMDSSGPYRWCRVGYNRGPYKVGVSPDLRVYSLSEEAQDVSCGGPSRSPVLAARSWTARERRVGTCKNLLWFVKHSIEQK